MRPFFCTKVKVICKGKGQREMSHLLKKKAPQGIIVSTNTSCSNSFQTFRFLCMRFWYLLKIGPEKISVRVSIIE